MPPPRLVVSKCLGFDHCRYDGSTIPDPVADSLRPWVEFIPVWPEEVGGTLELSAALSSLTRVVAPTVGGFLLGQVGAFAPGVLGALLMAWLVYYTWRRVLFMPDLACPAPRLADG